MRLTYHEARDQVIECTDISYTLRSLDRLWTCHIYDMWSDNAWWGNRIYFLPEGRMSYELFEDELVFTSYREAEAYRVEEQQRFDDDPDPDRPVKVYVLNLGDDSRWEYAYLDGRPYKPRFKHSQASITERERLWRERDARERNNA